MLLINQDCMNIKLIQRIYFDPFSLKGAGL